MLNTQKYQNIQQKLNQKQTKKQKGASMIEYALVVAAIVAIAGYFFSGSDGISGALNSKMSTVATSISGGTGGGAGEGN